MKEKAERGEHRIC